MKVALVYDRVNKFGGAEKVLLALHQIWPDAPLYTSVYNKKSAKWADVFKVKTSWLNLVPGANSNHEILAPLMPKAFESLDLSEYDVVISVTSAEAKGVKTSPDQLHICYLLTPTRYLWSHTQEYVGQGVKKMMRLPFLSSLRLWDFPAAQKPDYIITISKTVSQRVEKYYKREVERVIYPGVEYDFFSTKVAGNDKKDEYYLMVSRLVGYKNVNLVIETFNRQVDKKLIIVGAGRQANDLKRKAKNNVELVGFVDQNELRQYISGAKGLIFPQEEDYGIVALEAQAAGVPVIGYKMGGARETVVNEKTGLLYSDNSVEGLTKALAEFEEIDWKVGQIQQHAKKFDITNFVDEFKNQVEELWQKHQK